MQEERSKHQQRDERTNKQAHNQTYEVTNTQTHAKTKEQTPNRANPHLYENVNSKNTQT